MARAREFAAAVLVLALSACSASQESRELATETAGAVQSLNAALTRTALAAKVHSDSRVTDVAWLTRQTAENQADLQAKIDAAAGDVRSEYLKLRGFAETQEQHRQRYLAAAEAARKAAAGSQNAWQLPTESLRQTGGRLIALGQQESVWQRLKFTGKFVKEVAERVEQSRKEAEAAAAKPTLAPAAAGGSP